MLSKQDSDELLKVAEINERQRLARCRRAKKYREAKKARLLKDRDNDKGKEAKGSRKSIK